MTPAEAIEKLRVACKATYLCFRAEPLQRRGSVFVGGATRVLVQTPEPEGSTGYQHALFAIQLHEDHATSQPEWRFRLVGERKYPLLDSLLNGPFQEVLGRWPGIEAMLVEANALIVGALQAVDVLKSAKEAGLTVPGVMVGDPERVKRTRADKPLTDQLDRELKHAMAEQAKLLGMSHSDLLREAVQRILATDVLVLRDELGVIANGKAFHVKKVGRKYRIIDQVTGEIAMISGEVADRGGFDDQAKARKVAEELCKIREE
jgi:hypothetical protein